MQQNATILIIEDDPYIRALLTEELEEEGYQTVGAKHGREALGILRKSQTLPKLILLDLTMPVMSGWQFRQEQQRDERLRSIPVVVVSAAGSVAQLQESIQADSYIGKPINYDTLLNIVKRYCEEQ